MNKKLVFGLTTVLGTVAGVLLTKLAVSKIKAKKAAPIFEDASEAPDSEESPEIIRPNYDSKRILPKLRPQCLKNRLHDESDNCCEAAAG